MGDAAYPSARIPATCNYYMLGACSATLRELGMFTVRIAGVTHPAGDGLR